MKNGELGICRHRVLLRHKVHFDISSKIVYYLSTIQKDLKYMSSSFMSFNGHEKNFICVLIQGKSLQGRSSIHMKRDVRMELSTPILHNNEVQSLILSICICQMF
jgi:hypothetical protein